MSHVERSTHETIVRNLVTKYQQDGYRVIEEPSPQDLPFGLGNYRPDLIAQKGEEGYIIEVKSTGTRIPIDMYAEIAGLVAQHPGWRFLLVTKEDERFSEQPAIGGGLLSWDQIANRVERADNLLANGETEAAFLLLWAVFEALLRKQARQASIPIERFPSSALIKHLYSQGELSIPQFDQALALLELGNRAAHGFQTVDLGGPARQLSTLVHDLLCIWNPPTQGI